MLRQHLNVECRIQSNVNCYILEFNLYENKMNVIQFDDFFCFFFANDLNNFISELLVQYSFLFFVFK